ncbi:MAG: oligoribonuclease [Legionellales bacterium]|jgi:oligoribonuclease|nr:oligoribonuclease [Legionellales bacterium]
MSYLVWLDLEMTGLDPDCERIIEIATVVTDHNLEIVEKGPSLVINQSKTLIDNMDAWNTDHHTKSGLVAEVIASKINESDAELMTLNFLKKYLSPGESPLCGNTISQDRRFLIKYMPDLASFFHYRNLDVTSLKIMINMWRSDLAIDANKNSKHRALDDVYDSINELRHYRDRFLRMP